MEKLSKTRQSLKAGHVRNDVKIEEQRFTVDTDTPIRNTLIAEAEAAKRSLKAHMEWILEEHAKKSKFYKP